MDLQDCYIGQWVIYRPHPDAPPEDGTITDLRPPNVMVHYRGDQHAKSTRPADLTPGRI